MFKVNNKNTKMTSLTLFSCFYCHFWTYFTPFSSVSIAEFEKTNISKLCWHLLNVLIEAISGEEICRQFRCWLKVAVIYWCCFKIIENILECNAHFAVSFFAGFIGCSTVKLIWFLHRDLLLLLLKINAYIFRIVTNPTFRQGTLLIKLLKPFLLFLIKFFRVFPNNFSILPSWLVLSFPVFLF